MRVMIKYSAVLAYMAAVGLAAATSDSVAGGGMAEAVDLAALAAAATSAAAAADTERVGDAEKKVDTVGAADQELARVGAALAKNRKCLACHQIDSHRVGPPLARVGDRYADSMSIAAMREYLAKTIREGGQGKWSAVPMPAQPQVSEAEALILADWVLSLARSKP